ncbi:hypothetical protein DL93DRAFT_2071224 [Clavulina sp. PMI_390]|nr:hypothetical protein DL93DRAFT_2071224 [Clavulina sp. PMI_390]
MSADEYQQLFSDAAAANAEAARPVDYWLGATPSPQEDRSGYRGRRAESMTSPAVTRRSTLPLRGDNADLYSPYTSPTIPNMGGSTTPLQHGNSQDPRTPSPPSSALSNSGVRSNASKSSARKHRQSRSQRYLVEDEDDYEHPVSSSGHYDSEGLSRFTNDQLTVALGNLSPESSRTLSTPPRPTVNSRPPVGIMDSLGLSPDHPSRVQVGVRLQQSMMNSHISPARDIAGGGQRLLYPMAQAFPPIRGLNVPANFQNGVRVAEPEEYDDLYTAEEEEAARRATQRAQPSRIRDPTRSSTAQSSPSRYLNDTAPASAHYPTSRSSGSARSIQRRARGYEEDSDGDNQ